MKYFLVIEDCSCIGVHLNAGEEITVHSKNAWSTSNPMYHNFRFCGDIELRAGANISFLYEDEQGKRHTESLVIRKIKTMWERQPYMVKKVGILGIEKKSNPPRDWEVISWDAAEVDFNFLTR